MDERTIEALQKLRQPFPENQISMLPKPYKKDSQKGNCKVCGGYHGLPAAHLSYVGHAALTDRLLDVDPLWTWEPMSKDESGLPRFDKNGGLWINLTVCGVTRPGYGDAPGKGNNGGDAVKEIIGDALRNAAMRFGAALELWHKGKLHADEDGNKDEREEPDATSVDYWETEADKNDGSVKALGDWYQKNSVAIAALPEGVRKQVNSYVSQLKEVLFEKEKPAPVMIDCPNGGKAAKADCELAECFGSCLVFNGGKKLKLEV